MQTRGRTGWNEGFLAIWVVWLKGGFSGPRDGHAETKGLWGRTLPKTSSKCFFSCRWVQPGLGKRRELAKADRRHWTQDSTAIKAGRHVPVHFVKNNYSLFLVSRLTQPVPASWLLRQSCIDWFSDWSFAWHKNMPALCGIPLDIFWSCLWVYMSPPTHISLRNQ